MKERQHAGSKTPEKCQFQIENSAAYVFPGACAWKKLAEVGRVIFLQVRSSCQAFALKSQVKSLILNFEFWVLIKS